MKKFIQILALCFMSVSIFQSCAFDEKQFKDKDAAVLLDSLLPTPEPVEFEKQIGDRIAIITENGKLDVYAQILDKADTVYLISSVVGRSNLQEWVKPEVYRSYYKNTQHHVIAEVKYNAYKIRIGHGRLSKLIWLEGNHIYKAPWISLQQLKSGDSVMIRRFGDFEPHHAIVLEDVQAGQSWVSVKYNTYTSSDAVEYDYIFYTIAAAKNEDLFPGNILYYNKMNWVMMIAPKDSAHVIVRAANFPPQDKIVPIKHLQILK